MAMAMAELSSVAAAAADAPRAAGPVVSAQPGPGGGRAALPAAGGWLSAAGAGAQEAPRGQFIPVSGLDYLIGVDALLLYQTVDAIDPSSNVESENRYMVRAAGAGAAAAEGAAAGEAAGEALYIASETSSALQRCLCGAGRALDLTLQDGTRQEALRVRRRLAAASCFCPCRLQEAGVWSGAAYLGRVQQQWAWLVPLFLVRDSSGDVLYVLEGPSAAALRSSSLLKGAKFKIVSGDCLREEGEVSHAWSAELHNHVTRLQLPRRALHPQHKALLLAAAFLMEFTYFERARSRNCLRCNCF